MLENLSTYLLWLVFITFIYSYYIFGISWNYLFSLQKKS